MPSQHGQPASPPTLVRADLRCAVLIVGAGLAGLSTALYFERSGFKDYLLFEAEDRPGGWAKTDWSGAWGADRAIHVLHFRDSGIRALVESLLGRALVEHTRKAIVDSQGVRTPYPFHSHLHGRLPGIIIECLEGMWRASLEPSGDGAKPVTFADWIARTQGAGVARHFMEPYNRKLWTVPTSEMGWDWIGPFIPAVDLRSVLAGAFTQREALDGVNATLHYPEGGISMLAEAIAERVGPIRTQTRLVHLETSGHWATFDDGTRVQYDTLVSTVPLPMLMHMLDVLPEGLSEVAGRLESTDLVLVDVGFTDPPDRETHWVYLPDSEVLAHRLHQVHALSTAMVPAGHGMYCVEVAHSRHRPLPPGDIAERVVADLLRAGWLRAREQVVFVRTRRHRCAYAIPRVGAAADAQRLREHARSLGIHSVGRYGSWRYCSQEDALLDGRQAATELLGSVSPW